MIHADVGLQSGDRLGTFNENSWNTRTVQWTFFHISRSLPTPLFLLEFSALLLIRSDLLLERWISFQFIHSDRRPRERTQSSDFVAICTEMTFIQFCVSSAVCKRGWILPWIRIILHIARPSSVVTSLGQSKENLRRCFHVHRKVKNSEIKNSIPCQSRQRNVA